MKIPKIIHFIWAGGKKRLPRKYAESVMSWARANRTFKIYLWVDKVTDAEVEEYYQSGSILASLIASNQLILKDIEQEEIADKYIRYEINRLKPNFGKSSDKLRYRCLYKFGGVYFDSDIIPGAKSLKSLKIFNRKLDKHLLLIEVNSQSSGLIGNDGFISTRNNPLLKILDSFIEASYQNFSLCKRFINLQDEQTLSAFEMAQMEYDPLAQLLSYDIDDFIFASTIDCTGPGAVRAVVGCNVLPDMVRADSRVACIPQGVTQVIPGKDVGCWREVPIRVCYWLSEELINTVVASIKFEAEEMHMLRLKSHLNNIGDALQDLLARKLITLAEIEIRLIEALERAPINFSLVEFAQLPESELERTFYQNKKILCLEILFFPYFNREKSSFFYELLKFFRRPNLQNSKFEESFRGADFECFPQTDKEFMTKCICFFEDYFTEAILWSLKEDIEYDAASKIRVISYAADQLRLYQMMINLAEELQSRINRLIDRFTKFTSEMKMLGSTAHLVGKTPLPQYLCAASEEDAPPEDAVLRLGRFF